MALYYVGSIAFNDEYSICHWRPKGSRNGYTTIKGYMPIGTPAKGKYDPFTKRYIYDSGISAKSTSKRSGKRSGKGKNRVVKANSQQSVNSETINRAVKKIKKAQNAPSSFYSKPSERIPGYGFGSHNGFHFTGNLPNAGDAQTIMSARYGAAQYNEKERSRKMERKLQKYSEKIRSVSGNNANSLQNYVRKNYRKIDSFLHDKFSQKIQKAKFVALGIVYVVKSFLNRLFKR